jgi:hypothetical protein
MRLALKTILIVGGIAAVLIGLAHIALGPASIPGSLPVNATMDSEDRFYAAIFLGFGVSILWSPIDQAEGPGHTISDRCVFPWRMCAGDLDGAGRPA